MVGGDSRSAAAPKRGCEGLDDGDRAKARKLLQGSFAGRASAAGAEVSLSLEEAIFHAAAGVNDFRGKVRTLVASLRRNEPVQLKLSRGELSAAQVVCDSEQILLTDKQRQARAKVHKESLERCLRTSFGGLGYFVLGIDCSGKDCHEECERRHLDSLEQQRGAWPTLSENYLILCAGPERSGSTWLYNAVRLLHSEAHVPCDSYWMGRLSREKLEQRLSAKPPAVVLVKTHEWQPGYSDFVHMAKYVVLTHRDLRGVIASYRRVKWEVAIPDAYVSEHWEWCKRSTLDLAYEDIMRQGKESLRTLAQHLQLTLGEEGLDKKHAMLRDLKRSHSGNAVCQVTKLWPDHRSLKAQRLQDQADSTGEELNGLMDSDYARVLNSRFKEYQDKYGYI